MHKAIYFALLEEVHPPPSDVLCDMLHVYMVVHFTTDEVPPDLNPVAGFMLPTVPNALTGAFLGIIVVMWFSSCSKCLFHIGKATSA